VPFDELRNFAGHSPAHQEAGRPPHQRQVRLTLEQRGRLVDAYRSGKTVAQLVEALDVSRTTVLGHLERAGVARRPDIRKLTDADVANAASYYRNGESLAIVGKRFGVDTKTVARELRRANVNIRPRPGWR
jgi:IS30 family transposase